MPSGKSRPYPPAARGLARVAMRPELSMSPRQKGMEARISSIMPLQTEVDSVLSSGLVTVTFGSAAIAAGDLME